MTLPIFMDHHSTTPVDPRVLERMLPYFTHDFGNAASRSHAYGWKAEEAVEVARGQVAALLGATAHDIVLTSGATESNNLAILGVAQAYAHKGKHIVTQATEHKAVLDVCSALEKQGYRITYVPVDREGMVDPEAIGAALCPDTILVSVMAVNNEVGTVQPMEAIGTLCHHAGVIFHSDMAQATTCMPIDVARMRIDVASLSAHKMYGPKGVGALYVRRRDPRVVLQPQLFGGGHERGIRPGTLNVPGIVGMGEAARILTQEGAEERLRVLQLRDQLYHGIVGALGERVQVNGPGDMVWSRRHPGNLNLSFAGVDGETLLLALAAQVAVSSGSACTSATRQPSHVLRAMGVRAEMAHRSIRFGLGRTTTEDNVSRVADHVIATVRKLGR